MSMKADRKRWESPQGLRALESILQLLRSGGRISGSSSPFGLSGLLADLKGIALPDYLNIKNCTFENVDMSGAFIRGSRVEKCTFHNVKFDKADLRGMSDHGNDFKGCTFSSTCFQRAILGYDGTPYRNCVFEKSNFRGANLIRAEFDDCKFVSAKLKGVDFGASSFVNCSFAGKVEDVWFRGTFPLPSMIEDFGFPRRNRMESVSFAEASLLWMTFSNECDLSTVILPTNGEYRRYSDWPKSLRVLKKKACELDPKSREEAMAFIDVCLVHAKTQDWFILNCEEVIENHGEQVGRWIIDGLDSALVELR